MKNKKKKNSLSTIIFFLICVVLGGLMGFSLTLEFGDSLSGWQAALRILEGILLVLLAFLLQVILHEAGHMIAALSRGWSFIHFMILGVVLSRRDGKFHLSRFAIPGAGGQCLMMPPKQGDTDFGVALYNAGGVLMNAVIAVASFALLVVCYDAIVWEVLVLLASLGVVGVLLALVNGIPSKSSGLPNDGMNIRDLRKDAFSTHVFLTIMRAMGEMQQGSSLDEISASYLQNGYMAEGVKIDYTNSFHVAALSFDLSLAMLRLDFEKAHAICDGIEASFEDIVPIYQKELMYERVFLYLVSPREGLDVKSLIDADTLKYFNMQTSFRPTALRVKYAYACLYEKDEAKADAIYVQFQLVCERFHIPGEVLAERKLVQYVRELYLKSQPTATTGGELN